MNREELIEYIASVILGDLPVAAELYMCVKEDGGHALRRMQLKEETEKNFAYVFSELVKDKYIESNVDVKSMDEIDDNQNIFYTLTQTDEYYPFAFLNEENISVYNSEQVVSCVGYFIKLGSQNKYMYLYQSKNNALTINNDKTFLLKKTIKDVFTYVKEEVLRIEKRIDILIVENDIFTSNEKILERTFGLEKYIRNSAKIAIDQISSLCIMSSTDVFCRFEHKLSNSKKLMKIKDSPVLKMSKQDILRKINEIERYKSLINVQDGQIVVKNQNDVNNVLKLFGDAILKSELTNAEYETMIKKKLDSIYDEE